MRTVNGIHRRRRCVSEVTTMPLCCSARVVILLSFSASVGGVSNSTDIRNRPEVERSRTLYILGLVPITGIWPSGTGAVAAIETALEHIHRREDILPGYKLEVVWIDTAFFGNAGPAVYRMVEELHRPPTKVIVFGGTMSPVSQASAQVTHLYNLVQVSPISSVPELSNKAYYPNFFRLFPPEDDNNLARLAMMDFYNWRRVATIHQAYDIFSMVTDDLVNSLERRNLSLITAEIFQNDPSIQVQNLKKHDARIIIGGFYHDAGLAVFCEAYKVKLYGPKVVWFLPDWFDTDWWADKIPDGVDCTTEQIAMATEGAIYIGGLQVKVKVNEPTIAGFSPKQINDSCFERMNGIPEFGHFLKFHDYDATWAIALALNASIPILAKEGKDLTDFHYGDKEMSKVIKDSMLQVKFDGTLGFIQFGANGDPLFDFQITFGNKRPVVGYLQVFADGSNQLAWTRGMGVPWRGGRIPRDSTDVRLQRDYLSLSVTMALSAIAGVGIVLAVVFLGFNVFNRKKRLIKMSSPNLNNVILVGCVVTFMTVFFHEQAASLTRTFCSIRNLTMTLGFSLVFGALFSKTWRVHVIFTNKTSQSMVIKDSQLMGMVAALVGINSIILLTWELADPYHVTVYNTTTEAIVTSEEDLLIVHQVGVCVSTYGSYFTGALYLVQGLLLAFGAFLSWETQKVKVEALNDSQLIGTCIYNTVILSALGVALGFVLEENTHLVAALVGCFLLLATFMTETIIFIPKVVKVLRGQADVAPAKTVGDTGSTGQSNA